MSFFRDNLDVKYLLQPIIDSGVVFGKLPGELGQCLEGFFPFRRVIGGNASGNAVGTTRSCDCSRRSFSPSALALVRKWSLSFSRHIRFRWLFGIYSSSERIA